MIIIDNEFKNLIQALAKEEYEQLEANCIAEGIRDALVVWPTPEGEILIDGHNRYSIATEHNLPYKTVSKDFASRADASQWIILNQFGRRNLNSYQRSVLALKLKDSLAEQAKAKQGERTDLHEGEDSNILQISVKSEPINTQSKLAEVAGVSHDTIHKVDTIQKAVDAGKAPGSIREALASGEMSINQAYQAVRREEKKHAVKAKVEDCSKESAGAVDITKTDKKYNIIYADPPWLYWHGGNNNQENHYTTMSIDEICKLPVANLADDDCILFMWVTYPILEKAFQVMRAWGFEYATCGFCWVKLNKHIDTPFFGLGKWTRANSELCLIGTKGHMVRMDATISQVIQTPLEEHSKKPDCIRQLITKLVGELPRIELFARQASEGWDVWGNMV